MTKETNEALQALAQGIDDLLSALSAEGHLYVDYNKLKLKEGCANLRDALQQEPVED